MATKYAINDRAQLHKDANAALDQNLAWDETVRAIIPGNYDSALVATDRRVFVFKKGFMSGAGMGNKLSSWDYRNLGGVQLETGRLTGVLMLQGPGIASHDVKSGSDANKSPHGLGLVGSHFERAREGAALLRQLIAERQSAPPAAAAVQPDVMEQLRQLGGLRDAGILSDEEFQAKKGELLARM